MVTKEELREVGHYDSNNIIDLAKHITIIMEGDEPDFGLVKEYSIQILNYVKEFQRMSRAVESLKERERRRTTSMVRRTRY